MATHIKTIVCGPGGEGHTARARARGRRRETRLLHRFQGKHRIFGPCGTTRFVRGGEEGWVGGVRM